MNHPRQSKPARGSPTAPSGRWRTALRVIAVRPRCGGRHLGRLFAGAMSVPCVIGPGGFTRCKREGDGATPVGRFGLRGGFFRADRQPRPPLGRPMRASRPDDGWCDDPQSPRYNRPVRLPCGAGHERMWRADRLYDLGLVIAYNTGSPIRGRGSAIFLHVMAPGRTPTAGCVALAPADLRRLLPRLSRTCAIALG